MEVAVNVPMAAAVFQESLMVSMIEMAGEMVERSE
jgi:hypothetical protein